MKNKVAFVSGHRNLSDKEFDQHYIPKIDDAFFKGYDFIVGDAYGADLLIQKYLLHLIRRYGATGNVRVFHCFSECRNNIGKFHMVGGFKNNAEKDFAMTKESDFDIAWVRDKNKESGTLNNVLRRKLSKND